MRQSVMLQCSRCQSLGGTRHLSTCSLCGRADDLFLKLALSVACNESLVIKTWSRLLHQTDAILLYIISVMWVWIGAQIPTESDFGLWFPYRVAVMQQCMVTYPRELSQQNEWRISLITLVFSLFIKTVDMVIANQMLYILSFPEPTSVVA